LSPNEFSNHRLVAFENQRVFFRWKDYAYGSKNKIMTVPADEFLRRHLLHVFPRGLVCSTSMIRIPDARRESVLKAAECGPDIIDVPMAAEPEQFAVLVKYAKFATEGARGYLIPSKSPQRKESAPSRQNVNLPPI
jgi:hypothetical protein